MKQVTFSKYILQYYSAVLLLVLSVMPGQSIAQTDSTAKDTKEETTLTPLVDFISVQKSDNTIDLKATYKAKTKGAVIKLEGLHIMFFSKTDSVEKELGHAMTDRSGIALFNCKTDILIPDKEGKLHFKASFMGNKSIEGSDEELTIKRARLIITPVKEDSALSVQLKLVDLSTNNEIAIPEAGLTVFVKRLFSPLKIGEGKTDENGQVSVEIPGNLPGDAKGNITLLAKLEDNEQYGNLEAGVTQQWGNPVSDEIKELPRALWSSHPPLWMVITFIVLMSAVWGHYIVILYELFRLRKEHPETIT